MYTMDHPDFIVTDLMGNSIGMNKVNIFSRVKKHYQQSTKVKAVYFITKMNFEEVPSHSCGIISRESHSKR